MTALGFDEVYACIAARIRARRPGFIVTPNVNHVCLCDRDDRFRAVYEDAFLALPDGVPIILASRMMGTPLPQKLSGSDMVPALCARAAEDGFSVYFLGGTPGTADRTAELMRERHPALKVSGTCCPDYGFERDPEKQQRVIEDLRRTQPDICFVALGSPKQEYWMADHYRDAGAIIYMGVGATFDFMSGRVRRAPRLFQRIGLEWLWRVAMEPRRLWRRYLVEDLVFFKIFARQLQRRRAAARA